MDSKENNMAMRVTIIRKYFAIRITVINQLSVHAKQRKGYLIWRMHVHRGTWS